MIAALPLFLALYNDLKPIIQELGGPKGIIADGLAVHRAIQEAHSAVVAARVGDGKVSAAEGEAIAVAFVGEIAAAIARSAGVTDAAKGVAFAQRVGGIVFPKVFRHITGEEWAVVQAAAQAIPTLPDSAVGPA